MAANSWPFLQYDSSNVGPNGQALITLNLENVGIGPAKVETFELWWRDKPVTSPHALLRDCCGYTLDSAAAPHFIISSVAPRILPAGSGIPFISLERAAPDEPVWARFDHERAQLRARVCYCSVFDECWASDLSGTQARRLASCPKVDVAYSDDSPR